MAICKDSARPEFLYRQGVVERVVEAVTGPFRGFFDELVEVYGHGMARFREWLKRDEGGAIAPPDSFL